MKGTNRLNALAVKNAKPGMHHDGNGLYLRATEGGSGSWVVRFMYNKKAHYMGLGSSRFVSLADARIAGSEAIALSRQGMNPIEMRKARRTHIENKTGSKADENTLYRHFDSEGHLLYVGISLRAFARLCEHQSGAKWWLKIARVTIEQFGTRRAAEDAEVLAIKTELPLYNRAHKPKIEHRTKATNVSTMEGQDFGGQQRTAADSNFEKARWHKYLGKFSYAATKAYCF
jgi:hypothetical protein